MTAREDSSTYRVPEDAEFIGKGSFNVVFRLNAIPGMMPSSEGASWAYKLQMLSSDKIDNSVDDPKRSVRVWNEINDHLPAEEYLDGWVAPFIEGDRRPGDADLMREVLVVYILSRRVVVDAPSTGNFIKKEDGEIVCVDVGMALRRNSVVSQNIWKKERVSYEKYWDMCSDRGYAVTVKMIHFLKHIDEHVSPELISNDLLQDGRFITLALSFVDNGVQFTDERWERLVSHYDSIKSVYVELLAQDIFTVTAMHGILDQDWFRERLMSEIDKPERLVGLMRKYSRLSECGEVVMPEDFEVAAADQLSGNVCEALRALTIADSAAGSSSPVEDGASSGAEAAEQINQLQ